MNKQQLIQMYKSIRNVKINIENELVAICSVDELVTINERTLAIRRKRIDNPHITDDAARDSINAQFNKRHSVAA